MRAESEERYKAFVRGASPRLLTIAWLLTGDRHLAEDLVQETLTRMYAKWSSVRVGEELAYARAVLVRVNTDRWRRTNREVISDDPYTGAAELDRRSVDSRHIDLIRALQELPARERQVVVLRHYADLSEYQVATALGVSLGTVKSSASRGLGRLRVLLSEGDESHATLG